jgi:peptide deformylase
MESNKQIGAKSLPIMAYGQKILRKSCLDVCEETEELNELVIALWYTLETSGGVGLAAPQVNRAIKVFIVNSKLMYDDLSDSQRLVVFPDDKGIKETFINAKISNKTEEKWSEQEGCLSIPGIVEPVDRSKEITVEYLNENFQPKRVRYSGYTAKVIQHEYDHTRGVLFIDHLPPLSKKLLNSKLKQIIRGKEIVDYPIKYLNQS